MMQKFFNRNHYIVMATFRKENTRYCLIKIAQKAKIKMKESNKWSKNRKRIPVIERGDIREMEVCSRGRTTTTYQ